MTKKLYDLDSHQKVFTAQVLSCTPAQNGRWQVILDATAFFPEGGGQLPDQGTLDSVHVLDVQETPDGICHTTDGPLDPGSTVTGTLDWALRFGRMQCHSGEHIISGIAHNRFGCNNVGFHMSPEAIILDFDRELTWDQLLQIENEANAVITDNRPITAEYPPEEVLKDLDYRSKLDLTENVRIVTIPGCDVCACCAPHVSFTGEIGLVKLLSFMRHRGGVRIWMAAGKMALEDYQVKQTNIAAISSALSVKQEEAAQGVERMKQELQDLKQQLSETRQSLMKEKCKALPETDGNLCLFEPDLDSQGMRTLVNSGVQKCGGLCAVFTGSDKKGYRYVIGSQSIDLRAKAKEINQALSGKGGGQSAMIQGTATAPRKVIAEFLSAYTG